MERIDRVRRLMQRDQSAPQLTSHDTPLVLHLVELGCAHYEERAARAMGADGATARLIATVARGDWPRAVAIDASELDDDDDGGATLLAVTGADGRRYELCTLGWSRDLDCPPLDLASTLAVLVGPDAIHGDDIEDWIGEEFCAALSDDGRHLALIDMGASAAGDFFEVMPLPTRGGLWLDGDAPSTVGQAF